MRMLLVDMSLQQVLSGAKDPVAVMQALKKEKRRDKKERKERKTKKPIVVIEQSPALASSVNAESDLPANPTTQLSHSPSPAREAALRPTQQQKLPQSSSL